MSNFEASDDRIGKFSKWYKIGIAAVVCLVVSPVIFLVVKGIVGLALALGLGFTVVQLAPWFAIKLATWNLKLISKDAEENPVETRVQIEQQTEIELTKFSKEITNFNGSLITFKQQVAEIVAKYPEKTQHYREQVRMMEELLASRKRAWSIARGNLNEYKQETIEVSDLWEMANAANKMSKIAGLMKGTDPMKEFRTRVANKSVQNKMNTAMAQLSTALMEETSSAPLALNVVQPEVIHLDLKEKDYVSHNR